MPVQFLAPPGSGQRFTRVVLTLLALLVQTVLAFPQVSPAHAADTRRATGALSVYAMGEGAGESRMAYVGTGNDRISVPVDRLPAGALTGDKVEVTLSGDDVVSVRRISAKVRSASVPDGVRRALVIITSTTSPAASPTVTSTQVADVMTQVSDLYKMTSNNRISFTAVVATATVGSVGCRTLDDNVKKAKAAAGVDTAGYTHVIILVPDMSCGFAGLGSLGGSSVMVLSPSFTKLVVSHEIGHNLGLEHAASVICGTKDAPVAFVADWSSTCTKSEYGDAYSPMGALNARSFPALQLFDLGWLDRTQISTTTSGNVELSPLGGTSGTRALVLPDIGGQGTYWVEYRTPVGADADIRDPNQVQVRYQPKDDKVWNGVDLFVMNASGAWSTRGNIPGMTTAGQVFADPSGQLLITVVSIGATATVSVSITTTPPSLAPVALTARFDKSNLVFSFSAPVSGLRVTRFEASVSYASGVLDSVPVSAGSESVFTTVPPGPVVLTVTTKTEIGLEASASLELVAPPLTVSISRVTPTAGGAYVLFSLSADTNSNVIYTVSASRRGYSTRVGTTTYRNFNFAGLAAGGAWTISVGATVNGYTTPSVTKSFTPQPGGIVVGKVRKHTLKKSAPNAARALTVNVPWHYRTCWGSCSPSRLVGTFTQANGKPTRFSYKVSSSGRVVLVFSAKTTKITMRYGAYTLTPLTLAQ